MTAAEKTFYVCVEYAGKFCPGDALFKVVAFGPELEVDGSAWGLPTKKVLSDVYHVIVRAPSAEDVPQRLSEHFEGPRAIGAFSIQQMPDDYLPLWLSDVEGWQDIVLDAQS